MTNGKKQYGYLRKDIKEIINSIVDELGKDERIAALYDLWYESKETAHTPCATRGCCPCRSSL